MKIKSIYQSLKPIPRGRFFHSLKEDFSYFIGTLFNKAKRSEIDEYEKIMADFLGRKFCISFSYARTAFWAILSSQKFNYGDKILLPPLTIKPIADIVSHFNLSPIFVDIDLKTGSFDLKSLSLALKENPKVILLTYLFGVVPNVDDLLGTIDDQVLIIEDFSQCFNGTFNGRKIGTFGDISILSTSSVKTLDTYGGGLAFTDDEELARLLKNISKNLQIPSKLPLIKKNLFSSAKNFLSHPLPFTFFMFPVLFFLAILKSDKFSAFAGKRSNKLLSNLPSEWFTQISPMQARFGINKLSQILETDVKRRKIAARYMEAGNFIGSEPINGSVNTNWQTVFLTNDFMQTRKSLALHGIDCAKTSLVLISEVDFKQGAAKNKMPNAEKLSKKGIYFPCFHQLSDLDIERVYACIGSLKMNNLLED